MREQEISKRNQLFEAMQEKRKAKPSYGEKRRAEFKEYLDRLAVKGKVESKEALNEGVIVSGATIGKQGVIQNSSKVEMFSGTVSEIISKANKMLESKKNPIFIARIQSEAKSAISKIIAESTDEKVLTEAFNAIKSISGLKEAEGEDSEKEKEDEAEDEKDDEKEKAKEEACKPKKESAPIKEDSIPLEESVRFEMPAKAYELMKDVR